jgi:hypothetical protein
MRKNGLGFLLAAMVTLTPALSQAAPPDGGPDGNPRHLPRDSGNPPPRPTCTYSKHTCLVTSPDLTFSVNKINDITPSSSNDCKLLPPCGHRPPPRAGANPPPSKGDAPPPPPDDNAPPKP